MADRLRRRLAALAARPQLPVRTVRLRLTAVYGGLFLLSGAGLLAITYALMWSTSSSACYTGANGLSVCTTNSGGHGPLSSTPPHVQATGGAGPTDFTPKQLEALAAVQHAHEMHQLLIRSGIALAITAAISIALGWLIAGRALRPLRKITETTQAISATNLHKRLALSGPDDELKKLADTIDGLLARLEGAFDAQRRFVANASHELRTPLTVVRALLQMTLTDPHATLEEYRATCQDVLVEGERQERLIDALLVLARSERGLDHQEPLDLASITERALLDAQPMADRLGIQMRASLHAAPIVGDAHLAERLLTNLIDNALRHNTIGGNVSITTGATAGHALLSVSNTGPAIPPSELERLFRPFQRLGADSTDTSDGLGLGLSIVQAIANAHHASIQTDPPPAGGFCIEVHFPQPADAQARSRTKHTNHVEAIPAK